MSVQKDLVLGGHALMILPAIAVADDVANKRLTAAPLSEPLRRPAALRVGHGMEPTSRMRSLISSLREALARVDGTFTMDRVFDP